MTSLLFNMSHHLEPHHHVSHDKNVSERVVGAKRSTAWAKTRTWMDGLLLINLTSTFKMPWEAPRIFFPAIVSDFTSSVGYTNK